MTANEGKGHWQTEMFENYVAAPIRKGKISNLKPFLIGLAVVSFLWGVYLLILFPFEFFFEIRSDITGLDTENPYTPYLSPWKWANPLAGIFLLVSSFVVYHYAIKVTAQPEIDRVTSERNSLQQTIVSGLGGPYDIIKGSAMDEE